MSTLTGTQPGPVFSGTWYAIEVPVAATPNHYCSFKSC